MGGLSPHGGEDRVPSWCSRPGEVTALRAVASAMPTWQLVLSVNGRDMRPCIAAEETLAATLGIGRRTMQRRLSELRGVPGLLLEIPRGMDPRTGRRRPHARFAIDPAVVWRYTAPRKKGGAMLDPILTERMAELAHTDGAGDRWITRAEKLIREHATAAGKLRDRIRKDMVGVESPSAKMTQYGGGEGVVVAAVGDVGGGSSTPEIERKITRAAA